MSTTTLAQVRALVKTQLEDSPLQDVIDREEDLLAADVGLLAGERVETFVITDRTSGFPVRLRRPTDAVAVTENNESVADVRLGASGRFVSRLVATGWGSGTWLGPVEVTYTPNDGARIVSWVIELVRSRLGESAFESESSGTYSYNRGVRSHEATLAAARADILGKTSSSSRAVRSSVMSTAPAAGWIGTTRP